MSGRISTWTFCLSGQGNMHTLALTTKKYNIFASLSLCEGECTNNRFLTQIDSNAEWVSMSRRWQLFHMVTSSNGNIFRVTDFCMGNSPVTGEFPTQRPVTRNFDIFFDLSLNGWVNNHDAGDLRRHRAHYDVTVMSRTVKSLVVLLEMD